MRCLTLLPAAVLFAACAAPSSIETSQEQNLSARKVVEHETYVLAKSASGASEARANLEAACAAHATTLRELAGRAFLDSTCGEPEDLTPYASYRTFTAKAKTRFVVDVEEGTAPETTRTTTAIGLASGAPEAYATYAEACNAELARAKLLFGDRLLSGGCDKPTDATPSAAYRTFEGSFHAFVLPSLGRRASIEVSLRAPSESGVPAAFAKWTERCEAWAKAVAAVGKDKITAVDCGTPADVTPYASYRTMGSKATIEIATGDDVEPVTSAGPFVLGSAESATPAAYVSWSRACDEASAFAADIVGERLLAIGCGEPNDLTPYASYRHIASTSPILALPAGSKKLVVEGYAVGIADSSAPTARGSFGAAAQAALRASADRTGGGRVEGFGISAPADLTPYASYRLFGGKTTLHLGFESDLDPITSTKRLSFSNGNGTSSAAAQWSAACETEATNAKASYGDRFLAAACSEPTVVNDKLESDFTVW